MTTFAMPDREDALIRRIQQLERVVRELGPSVAASFAPVIADLQAKDVTLTDLIATQTVGDSAWGSSENFPLTGTWTDRASCTLVVPAGYTRIQFYAIASVQARNDVGSTQYLKARIRRQVNGVGAVAGGVEPLSTVPNLYWATVLAPYNWGQSTAGGDSHRFWVEAWGGGGTWTADVGHYARIEVVATFSR